MVDQFEDHCWQDLVPAEDIAIYATYRRETFVGAPAALLAIDLYEQVYQGGARPVAEVAKTYPMSCGEHAFAAKFRAFQELVSRCQVEYEYLGYARFQVSVKIKAISPAPPSGLRRRDLEALENLSAK